MKRAFIRLISITLLLNLVACGGGGGSDSSTPQPPPPPTNQVPVANAGNDQVVKGNTTVSLSGSGTDSDGTINSFQWTQLSGQVVTLTNKNASMASFTAPNVTAEEVFSFQLTVTDNEGATASDTINITVQLPDDITPPVITLNGDSSLTLILGENYVEFGATAVDDRDGSVTVTSSGVVDSNTLGSYTITYSASDIANNTSNLTRNITVIAMTTKAFITTWKTDGVGRSNANQIKIGTLGTGYNYQVNWGDGLTTNNVKGDITHTYAQIGTYTIKIQGAFPQIFFGDFDDGIGYDNSKLLSIEQWGDIQWKSMYRAFDSCRKLMLNATDSPDLSDVTNMSKMFLGAYLVNQDLSNWNVSNVMDMSHMFGGADAFNGDLSSWDVSSVTNMRGMFSSADYFVQDLNNWDVSSVTDMSHMFSGANFFNGDLSAWDVSSVTNMWGMFHGAHNFSGDLSTWDVSNVTNMGEMFSEVSRFNADLSSWNVSSVTNMNKTFSTARTFNQDLSNWDVANVTDMHEMFESANAFNADLSNWNVSSVTDMSRMFSSAESFNANLNNWNVLSVTNMNGMFFRADVFNGDISSWNVSSVIDLHSMFSGARQFNADISSWDVSKVESMSQIFSGATVFNQDLSSWDVSRVTDMKNMFERTAFNYDISSWNVSSVRNMRNMFNLAVDFDQDISNWEIHNVKEMDFMFFGVTLSTVNYDALLSSWSDQNVQRNVNFDGGYSKYSASLQSARDILIYEPNIWTITDGGVVP